MWVIGKRAWKLLALWGSYQLQFSVIAWKRYLGEVETCRAQKIWLKKVFAACA